VRARILLAIVGTTALAAVVLTVPLAVFAVRREHEQSVREMSLEAQQVVIDVTRAGSLDASDIQRWDAEWNLQVGVYLPNGRRVAGSGPDVADHVTRRAVYLQTNERVDGSVVVAQPVVVRGEKVATVRVTEQTPETGKRIRRVLLALGAFDVAVVAFAAGVGAVLAGRLARPVRRLRDDAVRLGAGDFAMSPVRSGIGELDETSAALADTASRLGETLRREREFTANSSHQLRTPLASLRVLLEGEIETPRADASTALHEALDEVDRLQATIATMLDVARGEPIERAAVVLDDWARELGSRWDASGRRVEVVVGPGPTRCNVSRAVVDQVTDILVTNALEHGRGAVTVSIGGGTGRLVVVVADEGRLERDPADLFRRNDPDAAGNGLGLALARSLAEAEGGRLVLDSVEPTAFRLSLPLHRPVDSTP